MHSWYEVQAIVSEAAAAFNFCVAPRKLNAAGEIKRLAIAPQGMSGSLSVLELTRVIRREKRALMSEAEPTPKTWAAIECLDITMELAHGGCPLDVLVCRDGNTTLASMCRIPVNDKVQYHIGITKHAAGFASAAAANMFTHMHSYACAAPPLRPYFCSRPISSAFKMFADVFTDDVVTLYTPDSYDLRAEADFCGVGVSDLNRRLCGVDSGYAVAVNVRHGFRELYKQSPFEFSTVVVSR